MSCIDGFEKGAWVDMIDPDESELREVSAKLDIDIKLLKAALDEEETSHIETEDGKTLIIIDIPYVEKETTRYSTIPLGIVVTESNIVTVCLKNCPVLKEFSDGIVRNVATNMKTRFIFTLLLRVAGAYLQHLRQIDKASGIIEKQLYKSQRNEELIQLLDLEKSLVFFSTSLKSNKATLEKLLRGKHIQIYEDDKDLLEDVLIEVHQAIEMADIYSSILSGTMDAFASVISNNLNVTMKMLTSLTIIITIPNIIFGFYGMNVAGLPFSNSWFPLLISAAVMGVASLVLHKRKLF
ncbi:MAG: magnesium transporter CorA family protein [Oscillospiraceae bacterium]|jgi:magnesium transporter|nr:magnesium transporter CorA family protein [Oscillospiraceae bacterium]